MYIYIYIYIYICLYKDVCTYAHAWTCGSLPTLSKTIVANLLSRFALAYSAWNSSGSQQDRTDAKRSACYIARLAVFLARRGVETCTVTQPRKRNFSGSVPQLCRRTRAERQRTRRAFVAQAQRPCRASATGVSQLLTTFRSLHNWNMWMTFTVFLRPRHRPSPPSD